MKGNLPFYICVNAILFTYYRIQIAYNAEQTIYLVIYFNRTTPEYENITVMTGTTPASRNQTTYDMSITGTETVLSNYKLD